MTVHYIRLCKDREAKILGVHCEQPFVVPG